MGMLRMQQIRKLFQQGRFGRVIVRIEHRLLNNQDVDCDIYERIPDEYLDSSALLLKYYGDKLIDQGNLPRAKMVLEKALRKFADQSLHDKVLSTMASLTDLFLRIGDLHEAKVGLSFLNEEFKRKKDQIDGRIGFVLAKGSFLLGEQEEPYYSAAIASFANDSATLQLCQTMIEAILRLPQIFEDNKWKSNVLYVEQFIQMKPIYHSYLQLFYIIRFAYEEKWENVLKFYDYIDSKNLSYYHTNIARIFVTRARIECGIINDETEIDKLEEDLAIHKLNLELQFTLSNLRFYFYLLKRDAERAQMQCNNAQVIINLYPSPILSEMYGKMRSRLNNEQKNEIHSNLWRINCFNEIKFSQGEIKLKNIQWKRKKAQELFVFLLLQPNYFVAKDQVVEALFTNSDPRKMTNQINVTIHQLNQAIKKHINVEQCVISKDGIIRLQANFIENIDVEDYSTLIRVADQLWITEKENSIELYEKAIQLYGELAAELQYIDWLEQVKENLRDKQLGAFKKLAKYSLEKKNYDRSEYFYRECLRIAPLQEETYQEYLMLLVERGRFGEAKLIFKRFEQLCLDELGVLPMQETADIVIGL